MSTTSTHPPLIWRNNPMFSRLTPLFAAALMLAVATSTAAGQRATPDPERAAARQVILEMAAHVQGGKWAEADSLFAARGVHVLVDTAAYHSWAEYRDRQLKL